MADAHLSPNSSKVATSTTAAHATARSGWRPRPRFLRPIGSRSAADPYQERQVGGRDQVCGGVAARTWSRLPGQRRRGTTADVAMNSSSNTGILRWALRVAAAIATISLPPRQRNASITTTPTRSTASATTLCLFASASPTTPVPGPTQSAAPQARRLAAGVGCRYRSRQNEEVSVDGLDCGDADACSFIKFIIGHCVGTNVGGGFTTPALWNEKVAPT